MPGARGFLGFAGLAGVLADHLQIPIEAPEDNVRAGGLCCRGDQEVDRRATMTAVRLGGQRPLDLECPLHT